MGKLDNRTVKLDTKTVKLDNGSVTMCGTTRQQNTDVATKSVRNIDNCMLEIRNIYDFFKLRKVYNVSNAAAIFVIIIKTRLPPWYQYVVHHDRKRGMPTFTSLLVLLSTSYIFHVGWYKISLRQQLKRLYVNDRSFALFDDVRVTSSLCCESGSEYIQNHLNKFEGWHWRQSWLWWKG